MKAPIRDVFDIVLIAPDGKEHNVGEARPYSTDPSDVDGEGNTIYDVTWYVKIFEEYVSVLVRKGEKGAQLEFRGSRR